MSTTITTRLAARKAATVEIPREAAIQQEEDLPHCVGHDASKQLETDGQSDQPGGRRVGFSERSDANQRDHPVHWTLTCLLLAGETEEVDPPLSLQGSSRGGRRAGFSQREGQDNHLEPGEELRAG
eukprot:6376066-Ditylum_brightwellii.AAC.1